MKKYAVLETAMGWMGVVASDAGVRRLTIPLPSPDEAMSNIAQDATGAELDNERFEELEERLQRVFNGEDLGLEDEELDLPDAPEFTKAVLNATRRIPRGETRSYGDLAAAVGNPRGARAVGQVMAGNPVAVLIPCHRVIASDMGLGGYGGHIEMKKRLLRLEGAQGVRGIS